MKRQVITSILATAAIASFVANAEMITVAEAEALASRFLPAATATAGSAASTIDLRSTVTTEAGAPGVYLFDLNKGNGFVIVAGDDNVTNPILGYSDEYSVDAIPPQMQYMLEQYAQEIAAVSGASQANTLGRQATTSGLPAAVEPLLSNNQWGQTAPFNALTPEINGQHAVTGCVATSTAQVMSYWKYPANGVGSWNYRYNDLDYISAKFSDGNYNWDLMPRIITTNSPQAQKDEVAKLMYHVGVAMNMRYGLNESSAYGPTVVYAMTDNFKYDMGTRIIQRPYFTNALWEQILRQELAAGRPVIYTGTSTTGGHQFVCDGYNAEGYFHINWGWFGGYNGYFRLTGLVPEGVDVKGFQKGYNYNQTAIIGMQPDQGHGTEYNYMVIGQTYSTTNAIDFNLYLAGYTAHAGQVNLEVGFMTADVNEPVVNPSRITKAEDFAVTPTVALRGSGQIFQKKFFNGTISCDVVKAQHLTDGEYYIYPVFRPAGSTDADWQIIPVKKSQSIHINVHGGSASVLTAPATTLQLDSFTAPTRVVLGQKARFDATLTALDGEFDGQIAMEIRDIAGNTVASAGIHLAAMVANDPTTFGMMVQIPTDIPTGTYTANLKAAGQPVGDPLSFEIKSGKIALDTDNFPEYAILAAAMEYDTDGDGYLNDSEISKVTRLNLAEQGMTTVDGLENFHNLQVLNINDNEISTLDLSHFPSLLSLQANNNNLMALNTAAAPGLVVLKVANNHIASLNVKTLTQLQTLDITNNPIAAINLTDTDALTTFNSDSRIYVSTADTRTIDLSDFDDVDPMMISNLRGATITGNYLTIEGKEAKYDYNTGDENHPTLPVTLTSIDADINTSGIDATEADSLFTINGLTISADAPATLINAAGQIVAQGTTLTAPAAGLYLLNINNTTVKVLLR